MTLFVPQAPVVAPPSVSRGLLPLIGNTPLVELTKLDAGTSRLFLKIESANPGGFQLRNGQCGGGWIGQVAFIHGSARAYSLQRHDGHCLVNIDGDMGVELNGKQRGDKKRD